MCTYVRKCYVSVLYCMSRLRLLTHRIYIIVLQYRYARSIEYCMSRLSLLSFRLHTYYLDLHDVYVKLQGKAKYTHTHTHNRRHSLHTHDTASQLQYVSMCWERNNMLSFVKLAVFSPRLCAALCSIEAANENSWNMKPCCTLTSRMEPWRTWALRLHCNSAIL
jgi:hypothetical protein